MRSRPAAASRRRPSASCPDCSSGPGPRRPVRSPASTPCWSRATTSTTRRRHRPLDRRRPPRAQPRAGQRRPLPLDRRAGVGLPGRPVGDRAWPSSALAAEVRRLLSVHERARDLIEVGAYAPGNDAGLDRAVALAPALEQFRRQDLHEAMSGRPVVGPARRPGRGRGRNSGRGRRSAVGDVRSPGDRPRASARRSEGGPLDPGLGGEPGFGSPIGQPNRLGQMPPTAPAGPGSPLGATTGRPVIGRPGSMTDPPMRVPTPADSPLARAER